MYIIKSILWLIGLVLITLFLFFSPSVLYRYNYYIPKNCEGATYRGTITMPCNPPLGGCFPICYGIHTKFNCNKNRDCFALCFGLNKSTCTPGTIQMKIRFWRDLLLTGTYKHNQDNH